MNDLVGLQFGDFTLDVSERLLLRDGRPVLLTPKAFDVLAALAARPGRLMTKDELLKEVWPDSFVEESNLAYHVFALRRALGDTDGERYVETVPKHGYRFVAPVKPANGAGLGSPTRAKAADPKQERAVDFLPDESESRDQSSEALEHGEPRAANTARDGQGALRFLSRTAVWWFVAGAFCASVILFLLYPGRPPASREPIKVEVSTGVRLTETSAFAISPDGRRLVFAGSGIDGVVRLWVRRLDGSEVLALPGT